MKENSSLCVLMLVYVDSDWAGDKIARKSTTGAVLKVGGDAVKTYSRNQKTIALSSGEAELYAIVSGIAEAIGIQSFWAEFCFKYKIRCFSDSSAAVGIVKRDGIGKVRHLQTQFLWVQEMTTNNKASIHKVGTDSNPADLLTTYLDSKQLTDILLSSTFVIQPIDHNLHQTSSTMSACCVPVSGRRINK